MFDDEIVTSGLAVGEAITFGTARLTADKVIDFAAEFDPQPMHTDPEAARSTFFKGLVASGWHVLALTMRLIVEAKPLGNIPLIGVEISNIYFRRPVPPDAVLAVRITLDRTECSGPNAFAHLKVETLDATHWCGSAGECS
jgi:acyl dehydratase